MNQYFSTFQLKKFCKHAEIEEFGLSEEDIELTLDTISRSILSGEFEFNFIKYEDFYLAIDLSQKLVLRKLNDNIKRIYKDEQSNRRIIISQVKTLLEESCPFWILKTDIKSFYESINYAKIIEKFQDDAILSFHSINLIKKIFNNPVLLSEAGLPRGMNISATLSEIYMRKFDSWVRGCNGVYYYARFVDDIIIFTHSSDSIEELKKLMNEKLKEFAFGLVLNEKKTASFKGELITEKNPLEYLGYKFVKEKQKDGYKLKISIADKKVRKIKTRIIKAFLDYAKNLDFELLDKRIRFLTGNFSIRKRKDDRDLRAGLYYNYNEVNDYSVFDGLNIFYQRALHSKNNSFAKKASSWLTFDQKKILSRYSFKHGFVKKVYHSFTFEETKEIISCW